MKLHNKHMWSPFKFHTFNMWIFHRTPWPSRIPLSPWILCLCRNALENTTAYLSFLLSSSYRPGYPWKRLSLKSCNIKRYYLYPQLCFKSLYLGVFCDKLKNIYTQFALCTQYMMCGFVFNKMSGKSLFAISNTSFIKRYSIRDYIQSLNLLH